MTTPNLVLIKMSKASDIEFTIEMTRQMYQLRNTEKSYTLYYDETNNNRKIHIREDKKLNVQELGDFVLGGIVYEGQSITLDFDELRKNMRLDKDIKDLKLKHLAKGELPEILESAKLNQFLAWLNEKKLVCHFSRIDPVYWSFVDIIDSFYLEFPEILSYIHLLKAELYELVKANLSISITILAKYDYPDVKTENTKSFLKEFLDLIEQNEIIFDHFNFQMLKGTFQNALKKGKLEFGQGYTARKLIESFGIFYVTRMLMFPKSSHVFDEELEISEYFAACEIIPSQFDGRFRFATSHSEIGIQISDILMGFLGKLFTFIRKSSRKEIEIARSKLSDIGLSNLGFLLMLMDRSEKECNAFIHHVASVYDIEKMKVLYGFESDIRL